MITLLHIIPVALVLMGLFTTDGLAASSDVSPPIARYSGTPEKIGDEAGQDDPGRIRSLMRMMTLRTLPARWFHPQRVASLIAGISTDHRAEIHALARAASVSEASMLAANVLVDSQCSALVSPASEQQPLRVARNMDFFPATTLGRRTVLTIVRPAGKHAFASIGWPGFVGVVSGTNDAGLTACILVNHDSGYVPGGQPICFRMREMLEGCATVDEAVACFAAAPIASSHYVLLADATTSTLVWQGRDGLVHRDAPHNGWLACSNGRRSVDGLPLDWRGRRLQSLGAGFSCDTVTEADMRQALTATYLTWINAQAMVFVPATKTLELAVGGMWHPAACSAWYRIELQPLFDDQPLSDVTVTTLASVPPLSHPWFIR